MGRGITNPIRPKGRGVLRRDQLRLRRGRFPFQGALYGITPRKGLRLFPQAEKDYDFFPQAEKNRPLHGVIPRGVPGREKRGLAYRLG